MSDPVARARWAELTEARLAMEIDGAAAARAAREREMLDAIQARGLLADLVETALADGRYREVVELARAGVRMMRAAVDEM